MKRRHFILKVCGTQDFEPQWDVPHNGETSMESRTGPWNPKEIDLEYSWKMTIKMDPSKLTSWCILAFRWNASAKQWCYLFVPLPKIDIDRANIYMHTNWVVPAKSKQISNLPSDVLSKDKTKMAQQKRKCPYCWSRAELWRFLTRQNNVTCLRNRLLK